MAASPSVRELEASTLNQPVVWKRHSLLPVVAFAGAVDLVRYQANGHAAIMDYSIHFVAASVWPVT